MNTSLQIRSHLIKVTLPYVASRWFPSSTSSYNSSVSDSSFTVQGGIMLYSLQVSERIVLNLYLVLCRLTRLVLLSSYMCKWKENELDFWSMWKSIRLLMRCKIAKNLNLFLLEWDCYKFRMCDLCRQKNYIMHCFGGGNYFSFTFLLKN